MTTEHSCYDGDGKRASATAGGTTTRYVYDVAAGLPALLDDGTRKYVWGAGGLAHSVAGAGTYPIRLRDCSVIGEG